jgi:ATP phosphoribosyltransferase
MKIMKFGLPKNKKLKTLVNQLFTAQDIVIEAPANDRIDYAPINGDFFQGTACGLKQKTIVDWVAQGRLSGGIIGYDCMCEFNARAENSGVPYVEPLEFLDMAECSLKIAIAEGDASIKSVKDLAGKRIATSYPAILQSYLESRDIKASEIIEMDGSVEMSIGLGEADAILDIVETGNSLKANGLKAILEVMPSQAVLIIPQRDIRLQKGLDVEPVMDLVQQLKTPRQRMIAV